MLNNYKVKINGKNEPVYTTKVRLSMNRQPSAMPFVIAESDDLTDVEIYSHFKIDSVVIRPLSLNINFEFNTHTIKFKAPKCSKLSVEINGNLSSAIGIFLNTPIKKPEKVTKYYKAGIHTVDFLELCDNDCLYLEKGAYLKGKIFASGKNIEILGNGIISAEIFDYNNMPGKKYHYMLEADNCANLKIHGITLIQSANWNLRLNGCDNACVSEVKIIGYRGNNDGIDVCGSRNVEVHDCFIRSTDDCLTVKGFNTGDVFNNRFYRCTLWNDYANPIRIGGIRAEKATNIEFNDIDIIHNTAGYPCFAYLEGNRANVSNVRVENLRIEDSNNAHLFDVRMRRNLWTTDEKVGTLKNISFKNIHLYGSEPKKYLPQDSVFSGLSKENSISGVSFENIYVYGKKMTSLSECRIDVRNFVDNVSFICDEIPEKGITSSVSLDNISLKSDGYYYADAVLSVKNQSNKPLSAKIRPEISPDFTHTYNRYKEVYFSLKGNETKVLHQDVLLRPGKYLVTSESDNISVIPSRKIYELELNLKDADQNTIKNLIPYQISDIDGNVMAEISLGKAFDGIWCYADILNEEPDLSVPEVSVFVCKKPEFKEGDAYFSAEETNEGRTTAFVFSNPVPITEPIMRCYSEIQWTLNNAPKCEKTVCITANANGLVYKDTLLGELKTHADGNKYTSTKKENTLLNTVTVDSLYSKNKTKMLIFIPFKELGFDLSDNIALELTVKPVLTNNKYMNSFSLFGSLDPTVSTHMYCPIRK